MGGWDYYKAVQGLGSANRGLGVITTYRPTLTMPEGSICPALAARAAARGRFLLPRTAFNPAAAEAAWRASGALLARRPLVVAPAALRGNRFGGLGTLPSDELDRWAEAVARGQEYADTLGMSATERAEAGYQELAARAGEISETLGIPCDAEQLGRNAYDQIQRTVRGSAAYDSLGRFLPTSLVRSDWETFVPQELFRQFAGVSFDQRLPIEDARGLWADMRSRYGDFTRGGAEVYERISGAVRDAAAQAGGGLRGFMNDIVGGMAGVRGLGGEWLNKENLRAATTNVNAWMNAISRGDAGSYLSAAMGTVSVLGAVIPQPAGGVVAATGAAVSFFGQIVSLFRPSEAPPPPIRPRTVPDVEAWIALQIMYNVRYGAMGKPFSSSEPAGKLAPELSDMGWAVTIDDQTGEVLVKNRRQNIPVYTRILDVFNRNILADPATFEWVINRMVYWRRAATGRGTMEAGAEQAMYWCSPNAGDIVTRFVGAADSERRDTVPLLRDAVTPKAAWGERMEALGDHNDEMTAVNAATFLSLYLGGTVPYGRIPNNGTEWSFCVSTGIGGDVLSPGDPTPPDPLTGSAPAPYDRSSIRRVRPIAVGVVPRGPALPYPRNLLVFLPGVVEGEGPSTAKAELESRRTVPVDELFRLMADRGWRERFRIPRPSGAPIPTDAMLHHGTITAGGAADRKEPNGDNGAGLGTVAVVGGVGLGLAALVWALTK